MTLTLNEATLVQRVGVTLTLNEATLVQRVGVTLTLNEVTLVQRVGVTLTLMKLPKFCVLVTSAKLTEDKHDSYIDSTYLWGYNK